MRSQDVITAYCTNANCVHVQLPATEKGEDTDLEEQDDAVDDLYKWSQELSLDELT